MANLLENVERGQIITAEMWNKMVDAVNELLSSSQTTGIEIAALSPAGTTSEPFRIGAVIQITGQSFGHSVGQTSVSFEGAFGGVTVPFSKLLVGSSDTRLLLLMPAVPGVTQSGATVSMRVSNGIAEDVRSVFVMPIILALQGDLFVDWRATVPPGAVSNPNPNPLKIGQVATYAYQLQSAVNMPASFTLSAEILNATAPGLEGLAEGVRFLDEVPGATGAGPGSDIPNKTVQLGKNETRNIYARLPQLPTGAADASFTLRIRAASTGAAGGVAGSDTRTFTVGAPVTPPDPNIDPLQETGHFVLNPATGDVDDTLGQLDGNNIQLKPGAQMILQFNVHFKMEGTYDVTIQPRTGATLAGWTLERLQTPAEIIVPTADETHLAQFGITPAAGAAPSGAILIRVKRRGAEGDQTKEYMVELT